MGLNELVEISNFYGRNEEYVLAGGGNTSFKDDDFLYIKGSGTTLATITQDGFVKMNRRKLAKMWESQYSQDTNEREAQVLADLMDAREDDGKRPSVETSLHDLFSQSYVVHTHPALVNGLTCSAEGEAAAREIFGEDVIWIAPTMPGYVLASEVKSKIEEYQKSGKTANLVFLANHGVFAAGSSAEEIKSVMDLVFNKIKAKIKIQPDLTPIQKNVDTEAVKKALNADFVKFECNSEILNFVKDSGSFEKVRSAFTPDHMVYYKHKALFVRSDESLEKAVAEFTSEYGFAPKIAAFQNTGIFACGESEKAAVTAAALFMDTVKIAVYAESFGGGVFMPDWLIDFIEDWEVESYRKSKS